MAAASAVTSSGHSRSASDRATHALLAGLRAQDPTVAGPMWRQYAPTVFRMLRRTLGPVADIDAAVQVVLLCVFHRGRRLGPRADLGQLVLRMTARIAQGELRQRPSRRPARSRSRAGRAPNAGDGGGNETDAVHRFYRILDGLSAPDRVAFVLHYIEGLDARAVAAATGASAARTLRRLRRSLQKVADGIEGDETLRLIGRTGNA
jgi:RNA polymerase sigma-70 factor (ECF subfamily)